jgi:glutathione S-transferase
MNNLKIVIGNKNYSSWSLRPWLLLKMFDLNFDEISVALYQDNTAEKLGPYSPSLKVPVLLHNETTVWDSLAICEYISEQLLDGKGWPIHPRKRANARSICSEVHAEFPLLKKDWPMNCKASVKLFTSEKITDEIARIDAIWSCCRRKYREDGEYLFGRFSIADAMYAPLAVSFQSYGAKLSMEAQRYADTLRSNAFVQEWVQAGCREEEPVRMSNISSISA